MKKSASMRGVLSHRDFRLSMASFAVSGVGAWAYNVALTVWLLETTGSPGWVAAATVGRFVPTLLASPYGGVLADRFERVGLMARLDVLCAAVMAALTIEMVLGVHPAVVVATAAISSVVSTVYLPATAAMTPQLVPERELAAANALRSTIDEICVIAGPTIGAGLLLLANAEVAVALNAGAFLISAVCLRLMRARSEPVDVTEGGQVGPLRQMLVGIQTIGASASTTTMVAFSIVATFIFGIDTVLFVLIADDVLQMGGDGYGYLLAGLGIGGILAAPLVTRLEGGARLGWAILIGIALYCLPTLLLLVVDDPAVAVGVQVVRGGATLVVDVLAVTALQRTMPSDRLARAFGAFDTLMVLAILLGSLIVPPIIAVFGIDGVLWFSGLVVPVACLAGLPWLRRMDVELAQRRADLAERTSLLARASLLGDASAGALDELANASQFRDVKLGQIILREGDASDSFFVVAGGTFVASHDPDSAVAVLSTMREGDYFGEIGLIERLPRTATVRATTDGRLLEVAGDAFLSALTREKPSPMLLDSAARRYSRTNPGSQLRQGGLAG